jgi:hypothetical protein
MAGKQIPDFLVIGAAKSGSTTLYTYLAQHPKIAMSRIKEPCFFSNDDVWARGWGWYDTLFQGAKEGQLIGEASTTYSRWPHTADAAKRIYEHCPKARIIYILRHPVDRAYSHYGHHMRAGVTMTFEEALDRDSIYVDCSRYMMQLERYLRFFAPERVLILLQSDLRDTPQAMLDRLQRFLGIEVHNLVAAGELRENTGGARPWVERETTRVFRELKSFPGVGRLSNTFPPNVRQRLYRWYCRSFFGRRLAGQYKLQPMKPETRERLIDLFEPDVQRLEQFTGRELRKWRT